MRALLFGSSHKSSGPSKRTSGKKSTPGVKKGGHPSRFLFVHMTDPINVADIEINGIFKPTDSQQTGGMTGTATTTCYANQGSSSDTRGIFAWLPSGTTWNSGFPIGIVTSDTNLISPDTNMLEDAVVFHLDKIRPLTQATGKGRWCFTLDMLKDTERSGEGARKFINATRPAHTPESTAQEACDEIINAVKHAWPLYFGLPGAESPPTSVENSVIASPYFGSPGYTSPGHASHGYASHGYASPQELAMFAFSADQFSPAVQPSPPPEQSTHPTE